MSDPDESGSGEPRSSLRVWRRDACCAHGRSSRYNPPVAAGGGEKGSLLGVMAGIDEAGYGPVLGPLVVSGVVFEVPDDMSPAGMWAELGGAVTRSARKRRGKIAITDSKKLFTRRRTNPLEHLERGVLGMLGTVREIPGSLEELLDAIAPAARREMSRYPWYAGGGVSLPRSVEATDLKLAANSLRSAMRAAGIRVLAIRSEPVFAGQYNRHVGATGNKSVALFDISSRILDWIWREAPAGPLRIYVDRHGGRKRYRRGLQRVFEGSEFKVMDETDRFSAYRITQGARTGEICFLTGGELLRLPVALASMTSKYVRELFMEMLNDFWVNRVANLVPTAGYYNDGRRFYREIASTARELKIDERLIYRAR